MHRWYNNIQFMFSTHVNFITDTMLVLVIIKKCYYLLIIKYRHYNYIFTQTKDLYELDILLRYKVLLVQTNRMFDDSNTMSIVQNGVGT